MELKFWWKKEESTKMTFEEVWTQIFPIVKKNQRNDNQYFKRNTKIQGQRNEIFNVLKKIQICKLNFNTY